jgi:hypothetical protein
MNKKRIVAKLKYYLYSIEQNEESHRLFHELNNGNYSLDVIYSLYNLFEGSSFFYKIETLLARL